MKQLEKVRKGLQTAVDSDWMWRKADYIAMCCKDALALINAQQERIKEMEAEISRLKHHVDCDAAEKIPSGCVGYGRGFNDDEPCETCKACEKYDLYGEE